MSRVGQDAPRVRVRGLQKRLGASFRLSVESLELSSGETLALVGPTGSGKTTLIRLLAGLEPADEGTVAVDGASWQRGKAPQAVQRRVAWVPQTPLLLRGSVRYNVAYGRRIRNLSDDGSVERLLESFELTRLADQSA